MLIAAAASAASLCSCAGDREAQAGAAAAAPEPGTRAYDMQIWHSLLRDHDTIRRVVRHLPNGVDATTESDDPDVAARIIDHGKAMQARVASGARVRAWDPVFADLFAKHDAIRLEVTTTARGVRIVETSEDPEVVALLRSHAMGVSEFVRSGFDAAPKVTPRIAAGDPIPANEAAIGGVPHRFLLEQPTADQMGSAGKSGVATVINFRPAREQAGFDEMTAATRTGMTYCNVPYGGWAELTDEVLDQARVAIAEAAKGGAALLHCRTGNRVGPAWAAYRVLDQNVGVDAAIAEAYLVGMVDPLLESRVREYIRARAAKGDSSDAGDEPGVNGADGAGGSGWTVLVREALSTEQVGQREHAIAAKDAMFNRLMAALSDALARPEGPIGAIGVCREEAPRIAQSVSRESGVMMGRTSLRARNPMNGAPSWARDVVARDEAKPAMFANGDGGFGIALPIVLADNCLMCHGDPARMDPALVEVIAKAYPRDRATGFAAGDLRGWFWVEVPPGR